MDAATHGRSCETVHGVVNARRVAGTLLVGAVMLSLACGIAGGLARTGVTIGAHAAAAYAAVWHAALMICGFFGTVIGIERAVAAKLRIAWLAPLASAASSIALLSGSADLAGVLLIAASAVFFAVTARLWSRERAPHTFVLTVAAACWLVGNVLFAASSAGTAVLPWWFAFLVVTIAAERLEMTRLMPRRPLALRAFAAVLVALLAGAAFSALVFGAALFALAAWLLAFDVARRTMRAQGLARYMAVCLIAGYLWLAIGGLAWVAESWGWPTRDTALHALGLGFIVSMVMAHAPVILPAVARIKVAFSAAFYVPLAILHASLAWRLAGPLLDGSARAQGATANAAAIALFALTIIACAFARRRARR
jgi:hypothetical protein